MNKIPSLCPLTPSMATSEQPLSVSELSGLLKACVEESFVHVRVSGEVASSKQHSSGHLYASLREGGAVLDIICWRSNAHALLPILKEGNAVVCKGKLTTYPGRSKYQMIVTHAEEDGAGDLLKLLEERKKRLAAEGLFAAENKRPLPRFPQRIGVITSETGAVLQDIFHRLNERFPLPLTLFPVTVQGDGAVESMVSALQHVNNMVRTQHHLTPDVLILARGGGSAEDLFVFNDEALCRAVSACLLPIVSAIGHETDTHLTDYVADQRAPTPTAAAELCTPDRTALSAMLQERMAKMHTLITHALHTKTYCLQGINARIPTAEDLLAPREQGCDLLFEKLAFFPEKLQTRAHMLSALRARIQTPHMQLQFATQRLHHCFQTLTQQHYQNISWRHQRLQRLDAQLTALSHTKTLERGFCLALDHDKRPLTSKQRAQGHISINLAFHDGILPVTSNQQHT